MDLGSCYLPSDILAAYLCGQLEARDSIQACRGQIWNRYARELTAWADETGVSLPVVPGHCDQPYHMFYLLHPSLEARTAFIAHLKRAGVQSVFHYVSLHLSPMGRSWGYGEGDCPVTEAVSDHLVRLPLHISLTAEDQTRVCEAVRAFGRERRGRVVEERDRRKTGWLHARRGEAPTRVAPVLLHSAPATNRCGAGLRV